MRARAIVLSIMLLVLSCTGAGAAERALVLDIDGAIGPAIADYIVQEIDAASPGKDGLIVIRINTPGGLDSSMRAIDKAILASPVPVATFVAPSGARAASAGTYIAYASAIAAMAPGTNIGAATPVQIGGGLFPSDTEPGGKNSEKAGEPADTESRKIVNDAVAYIRSLAAVNGRNSDWAEQAVRFAASLPAADALKMHVVDIVAADLPDLLRQIDGRTATVAGKPQRLATEGLTVVTAPPDWRTEALGLITDPNIAFLLMLIGVYGLIIEFFHPGAIAPGLVGAICLIAAFYGLALLPINYAGAALVLLGIGLMIAEVHVGAFGALGIGGIAVFVAGALLMFPARVPGFALSNAVLAAATAASAVLLLFILGALLRSRRRPVVTGGEALVGAAGDTVSWQGNEGRVRVAGEIWRAQADVVLPKGSRVRVVGRDGLVLLVEPADSSAARPEAPAAGATHDRLTAG